MVVTLLAIAATARFRRSFVVRHYELICASVLMVGIVFTSIIASLNQLDESPYSRYWGVFSSTVFGTCVIYCLALRVFRRR